jgi:hypothetical protein
MQEQMDDIVAEVKAESEPKVEVPDAAKRPQTGPTA